MTPDKMVANQPPRLAHIFEVSLLTSQASSPTRFSTYMPETDGGRKAVSRGTRDSRRNTILPQPGWKSRETISALPHQNRENHGQW